MVRPLRESEKMQLSIYSLPTLFPTQEKRKGVPATPLLSFGSEPKKSDFFFFSNFSPPDVESDL
jgi:hypothetical protein